MNEFIWMPWNTQKVANHNLTPDDVEFAWANGRVVRTGNHPINGPYSETEGTCPSGRVIRIVGGTM